MILAAIAAVAASSMQPQTVATIDPGHRLVEGVATDGRTIWASSVLDRTIIACRRTCRTLTQLPAGLHPLGIVWDKAHKRLWIAADCPQLPGIAKCDRGALLSLDRTGRLRSRLAPEVGQFHPGDVSAADGRVFVSDSQDGIVRALGPTLRTLMAVVLPGMGKSAQGAVLDPTGKQLIVADYSLGIATIDLATFKRTPLPRQDGKPLRGVDGLVRCGATYFGIYNGVTPGRLMTFTVGATGITVDEPLPDLKLPDPTQIAFDGKRLLIVSEAGWEAAGKGATARAKGAPILAIPLSKDCQPI